jgi:hypothetical protein
MGGRYTGDSNNYRLPKVNKPEMSALGVISGHAGLAFDVHFAPGNGHLAGIE